jgi:hypothetical protein
MTIRDVWAAELNKTQEQMSELVLRDETDSDEHARLCKVLQHLTEVGRKNHWLSF